MHFSIVWNIIREWFQVEKTTNPGVNNFGETSDQLGREIPRKENCRHLCEEVVNNLDA